MTDTMEGVITLLHMCVCACVCKMKWFTLVACSFRSHTRQEEDDCYGVTDGKPVDLCVAHV